MLVVVPGDGRDVRLDRLVALKVLAAGSSEQARQRFLREVQVVAGLVHPNVVALYAAGEEQGHAFAAMELLPGSLAHDLEVEADFGMRVEELFLRLLLW